MELTTSDKLEKISKGNYSTLAFKTSTFRKSYGTISTVSKYFYTNHPDFIFISRIHLNCHDRAFWYSPEKQQLINDTDIGSFNSRKSHLCEIFRYEIIKLFCNEKG